MDTPICDFVRRYCDEKRIRLHMPGHKGKGHLGFEELDITEIDGADSLYEANGIIAQSEKNASVLFGANTFFSTEGSSHCIRSMLYLCMLNSRALVEKPLILAGRNSHKTFVSAAALLDFDVEWIYPDRESSYLSCAISPERLDALLESSQRTPAAVYITSPDYLGNMADIVGLAEVCHRHGVLLAVDNAHGAYLNFLTPPLHPIALGADICCDSAHKTLPVLTGGAYLHISHNAPDYMLKRVKAAMALFGSTSPSYLILQSLDMANLFIYDGFAQKLKKTNEIIAGVKSNLAAGGFEIIGNEPMKITVSAGSYGYKATELADILNKKGIVCEFCDPDYIVFMPSTETNDDELLFLENTLLNIPKREALPRLTPEISIPERVMGIRQAIMSESEALPIEACLGRVLSDMTVGCPPAVPIVVCGERIDRSTLECFRYYGIKECMVIKEF